MKLLKITCILSLIAAGCTSAGQSSLDDGLSLMSEGKQKEGLALIKAACFEHELSKGCVELSKHTEDKKEIDTYLSKGCEIDGNLEACYQFGISTSDKNKSKEAFAKACQTTHLISSPRNYKEELAFLTQQEAKFNEDLAGETNAMLKAVTKVTLKKITLNIKLLEKTPETAYNAKFLVDCKSYAENINMKKESCNKANKPLDKQYSEVGSCPSEVFAH